MSDKIEPALSAAQWADLLGPARRDHDEMAKNELEHVQMCNICLAQYGLRATIAICNAGLRDDDPRKITHGMLDQLAGALSIAEDHTRDESDNLAFVEALRSYLPPES